MRKAITLLVVNGILLLTSCGKDENTPQTQISEIQISEKANLELKIGEISKPITVSGGNGKDFEITSENTTIAKVNQKENKFTIEAIGVGKTTVSIKSAGKAKNINVMVSMPDILLSENTPIELKVGDSKTISITSEGDAKNFSITPSSDIIKVEKKGKNFAITALKEGDATIIISAFDKKTELKVKVVKKEILIEKIEIEQEKFRIGQQGSFNVTITPSNATNQNLEWKSLNPDVIKVDRNGKYYVLKKQNRQATITATAKDGSGVSAEIKITVYNPVKEIHSINLQSSLYEVGVSGKIKYDTIGLDKESPASDGRVSWKSDNSEVVSIDEEGNYKLLKEGTANIIGTANDGFGAETTIHIRVFIPVTKIIVNEAINKTLTIQNRTEKLITITSFNDNKKVEEIVKGKSKSPYVKVLFNVYNMSDSYMAEITKEGLLKVFKKGTFKLRVSYQHSLDSDELITQEIDVTVN